MVIPYIMLLHGASDLGQRCLKTHNSEDKCSFQPNIFAPTPKPHFWGPFNAKPIIQRALIAPLMCDWQRALCQLHINGATTLKLYDYIGIGKYLGVCQNFPLGGIWGAEPLNVNLGRPIISETTGARKLKLKTQLHVVKYSLRVQKFFR